MLKPEEMRVGRRNFMKAAAVVPAAGAYALTAKFAEPVNLAWIGTGGQGRVLMENMDPAALRVQAVCDIRPDFRELGAHVAKVRSNPDVRVYSDYKKMLSDGGFEAVIIATPLATHAQITLDCFAAGKHVLCEKTMAYHAKECEDMIKAAEKNNLVLAVGHQRHANPLYRQSLAYIQPGPNGEEPLLGDVYHIRSLWHRNHSWRRGPGPEWRNEILKAKYGEDPLDAVAKMKGTTPEEITKLPDAEQFDVYFEFLASKEDQGDFMANMKAAGFDTPDMLGNWRLYEKMSHGLMSELGSHQIDVCNWFWGAEPIRVSGEGGIFKYKDGREVDDHVFAIFRYPNDKVMTFSSITTNDFDHYYDQIMGTKGTVYLTGESQAMLYKQGEDKATSVEVEAGKAGGPVMSASQSRGADMAGGGAAGEAMDGYNQFAAYQVELNMFAAAIRKGDPTLVGCDGRSGYKAAIAVLKSVDAIKNHTVEDCVINFTTV
jgi:predicted dehydrogenase